MQKMILLFLFLFIGSTLAGTISGKVSTKAEGDALIGANVYLKGTTLGAATDENGEYSFEASDGRYTIVCEYVGYGDKSMVIDVEGDVTQDFELVEYLFSNTINVIADRARERETPVAFTNVSKEEITNNLGSRDIPLVLNTTPSVYSTAQGGGAGDARLNIRGFNQRNISIMINGVPVNDMENGWVYWSNWDGVGDATSSIQVQRGLSAVNLATPSIGGTMNILTDPSSLEQGVLYKNEIGSGEFSKQSLFLNSGLVDNKFAISFGGVRKTGVGVADKTWTDAWAYYLGASYQLNDKNRIEFYATGAPQRHGQRLYALNAANYDHEFARDELGYSEQTLNDPRLAEQGSLFNPNWNAVDPSYTGKQAWNGSINDRHSPNFLMERENFYHKPIVNLNWYSQLSDKMSLYNTLYYSGGEGGGTGTFGGIQYDYSLLQRVVDFNATIAANRDNTAMVDLDGDGTEEEYVISTDRRDDADFGRGGILRNSRNNQWTIGLISKAFYKVNKNLNTSFGIDLRTAEIEHYREVRDLLGNDFYHYTGNDFDSGNDYFKGLGDKIDYNFTNTVDWAGGYLQAEYSFDRWNFYGTFGASAIHYTYENFFRKEADGSTLDEETDWILGYQLKGGANYLINRNLNVFANAGFVSKVPIFDQVINDRDGSKADDPKNEKFISVEAGTHWTGLNNRLNIKANVYYTTWDDRAQSIGVTNDDGSEGLVFLDGISSVHSGIELEAIYQPLRFVRLDVAASFGDWSYTDNVAGTYVVDYTTNEEEDYIYYIKDLKTGDAPETQFAAGLSVFPIKAMRAQLVWKYFADYYAGFDPFSRTEDYFAGEQSWLAPDYNLFDLHFSYDLPFDIQGARFTFFAHVFNLFDAVYVQDATDNSRFNGYYDNNPDRNDDGDLDSLDGQHTADDAEVFLGLPRTFNLGFSVRL